TFATIRSISLSEISRGHFAISSKSEVICSSFKDLSSLFTITSVCSEFGISCCKVLSSAYALLLFLVFVHSESKLHRRTGIHKLVPEPDGKLVFSETPEIELEFERNDSSEFLRFSRSRFFAFCLFRLAEPDSNDLFILVELKINNKRL
ncbi:hypothetical protein QE152_g41313, partial [Popillia japonica]